MLLGFPGPYQQVLSPKRDIPKMRLPPNHKTDFYFVQISTTETKFL